MYKSGKTINKIANERGMSITTIEGHLANFIETGELKVDSLVMPEKLKIIFDSFMQTNHYGLTTAKEALGNDVSYSELRFALKHLQYTEKAK